MPSIHFNEFGSPESPWCPLFGVLPYEYLRGKHNFTLQECITVIENARALWGSFQKKEHYEMLNYMSEWASFPDYVQATLCPSPEQLPFFPKKKLLMAREFSKHWNSSILPAMEIKSTGGELTDDEGITTECEIYNLSIKDLRNCVYSSSPIRNIRPKEVLSLIAICICWDILILIFVDGERSDKPDILKKVYSAQTFLAKAFIYAESDDLRPDAERGKKVLEGAKKGQKERKKTKQERWKEWQEKANAFWNKFPSYSKHRVAGIIAKEYTSHETPVTQQTIEKKIIKPS